MRRIVLLSSVLLFAFGPSVGLAQTTGPPFLTAALQPYLAVLGSSGVSWCKTNLQVIPEIKGGYQWVSFHASIPVPTTVLPGPQNLFNMERMDVSLGACGVWVGGVRTDLKLPYYVTLFAEGFLNGQRNSTVETDFTGDILTISPIFGQPWGGSPWEWTGSRVQWWSLDGGASVETRWGIEIVGGFRVDRTDMHLVDPRNATGPIAGQGGLLVPLFQDREADFRTQLWIPYAGFQAQRASFKCSLIGSPLAWVQMQMPFRWNTLYDFFGIRLADSSNSRYGIMADGGRFLEANLQYNSRITSGVTVNFWGKASWFSVNGRGTLDSQVVPGNTALLGLSGSADVGDAKVRRYLYGGGLAATVVF